MARTYATGPTAGLAANPLGEASAVGTRLREYPTRAAALFVWCYGFWLLLTWTVTPEQLVFGAILALTVALTMAPLGPVARPWRLADPRRFAAVVTLFAVALGRIVRANLALARRIWLPSRPLSSGMLIIRTDAATDGEIAAIGLITSLIVDNQIVDLDRSEREFQYHTVAVPDGDPRTAITAPVEQLAQWIRRPE
jgi:multicomponent Na+:H+ antiporter subunit E